VLFFEGARASKRGMAALVVAGLGILMALLATTVVWYFFPEHDVGLHDIATFPGLQRGLKCITYSPTGKFVVTGGGADETITVWDPIANTQDKALAVYQGNVEAVTFAPDGQFFVSGSDSGEVRIWDVEGWVQRHVVSAGVGVYSIAFLPDGRTIVAGDADGAILLIDAILGVKKETLRTSVGMVVAITVSPAGTFVAAGGSSGQVELWDLPDSHKRLTFAGGHRSGVTSLCSSDRTGLVFSGDEDGVICSWDAATGQLKSSWKGHGGAIKSLGLSPDGLTLASAGLDRKLRFWEAISSKRLATCQPDAHCSVEAFAYSPDGSTLALGFGYGLVKIVQGPSH
jgi:WD domain, G-beta repeat